MRTRFSNIQIACALAVFVVVLYTVLLAFAVSLATSHGTTTTELLSPGGDAQEYVVLAHTMLSSHRYAHTPDAPPEFFRSPGYPAFAAMVLAASDSVIALSFAQILLIALSVALIFLIGAELFSRGVGMTAALLFAVDPSVLADSFKTLSEPLFVALLLLIIWLLVRRDVSLTSVALAALATGALTLTRPLGIFLAPLFVLWLVYRFRARLRRALVLALLFLAVFTATVAPWVIRNGALSGHYALSSVSTYNMLFYNIVEFEVQRGASKPEFVSSLKERLGESDSLKLRSFEYAAREKAIVGEYLAGSVPQYAFFHIVKTIPFFLGSGIDTMQRELFANGILEGEPPPAINISSMLLSGDIGGVAQEARAHPFVTLERIYWLFVILLGAFYGAWHLFREREKLPAALLFAAITVVLAILTGPVSAPRYRMPVEPFLLLLAAAGATLLYAKVKRSNLWKKRTS
ncbi:MAG: glycosyltransferase family 39 protein [Patescibacteria group bacterium]|nr:glycosyltransferase family 39 protein [Patescibacteria group bacterium]